MELNEALRDVAYEFASKAKLNDSANTQEYRSKYNASGEAYVLATKPPSVIKCDSLTSDVYYSGKILGETFENVTSVWTNGSGIYCMTAQEDNGLSTSLEDILVFRERTLLTLHVPWKQPAPRLSSARRSKGSSTSRG